MISSENIRSLMEITLSEPDFASHVSDKTIMSASVDLAQICSISIFGSKLQIFRSIIPSPDFPGTQRGCYMLQYRGQDLAVNQISIVGVTASIIS